MSKARRIRLSISLFLMWLATGGALYRIFLFSPWLMISAVLIACVPLVSASALRSLLRR